MKKTLILSALASSILLGCGGGGGGSSSSPAPAKKYTFQFVHFDQRDVEANSKCTTFDVDGQSDDKETIAILAKNVTVTVQNADGSFASDLSGSISDNGLLTFTVDDVEDGGYISVVDSPSNKNFYNVLSIQKELLTDLVINIDRDHAGECYEQNKLASVKTGYASVNIYGVSASRFSYDSSRSSIGPVSYTSRELSAFDDESVLVRGFENTNLVGYAFVSSLTETDAVDDKKEENLSSITLPNFDWSIGLSADELQSLSIRLNNDDYSYSWSDAEFDTTTKVTTAFPYVVDEANWSYTAKGLSEDWSFSMTDVLGDSLNVNLPDSIQLTNDKPTITANGSTRYNFEVGGFNSSLERVQRSYYKKGFDVFNTLDHVIYSKLSGSDIVIPELKLANLDASDAKNVEVDILSADTISADLATYFMQRNAGRDIVSVVTLPSETAERNKLRDTSSYTLLSR